MVQVEFERPHDTMSNVTLTKLVWVDASWNLDKGDVVSFKGDETKWHVRQVYEEQIDSANLEKKWGLDLPKSQRTER